MTGRDIVYSVSDFVAVCNQVLDVSFGSIVITGELSQFRISKNRWVYFDLKDDYSSVRFFGTVYQLPGPLEDGMLLTVRGVPQLHPRFGFSITIQSLQLAGEGTIKKAAQLLEIQLEKEGLFADDRKRILPYPPQRIGLITSGESAAYADFIKIMNERWGGVAIELLDVQVQGEQAPTQIVGAIQHFNASADAPDVLVIIRGGGSADDLQAFNTEQVTRAVAASRIPTIVAIGHETDTSLAERAADRRASTPSNAAQLLTPDRKHELTALESMRDSLYRLTIEVLDQHARQVRETATELARSAERQVGEASMQLGHVRQVLHLLNPLDVLRRGYAIVRRGNVIIGSAAAVPSGSDLTIQFADGEVVVKTKENGVK